MLIDIVVRLLLVIVGAIHIWPGVVALSPRRAGAFYGTRAAGPDLTLLLRHRAILLATVGVGLLVGAVVASVRPVVIGAAVISMTSFIVFAMLSGMSGLTAKSRRIVHVDLVALALVVVAAIVAAVAD
ncbi:hypothetical protein [Nocardia sp. NPDC049149]|uniref:hypothetical protein n=1 Tax=Nocardia sp. NPDC049149 TaxID=3364315 RepID=UPI00371C97EC